jgi:hypothetical protein
VDLNSVGEVFNSLCGGRGSGFVYLPSMKEALKAECVSDFLLFLYYQAIF